MLWGNTSEVITRWLGRAGFAVADQAVLSGTTLVLNVLFARWMSTEEFGLLAVEMSCILLLSGIHNALILEPMSVFGAHKYGGVIDAYVRKLGILQFAALVPLLGMTIALVGIDGWLASPQNAFTFGLTLCSMMLFAFVRRSVYLEILPHLALAISTIYAVTCIGLALVAHGFGNFSPANALQVIAVGSGLGSVFGWGLSRGLWRVVRKSGASPTTGELWGDHWRYGRWILGTTIVYVGSSAAYPPLIASILDLQAAGTYRAIETLFAPVGQLITAVSTLALPAIVAQRGGNERAPGGSVVGAALLGSGGVAALYVVPMVIFGPAVARFVFAKPEYASDWWIIAFIGLAAVLGAMQSAAYLFLRSIERPHGEFWSQLSVAAATFTIGIGAAKVAGLDGLTAALVMARSFGLVVALRLLGKELAKHERLAKSD